MSLCAGPGSVGTPRSGGRTQGAGTVMPQFSGVLGSEQMAHDRIKSFLTSGLMSFDDQAFRVTLEEERWMGISDPSALRCTAMTRVAVLLNS